MFKRTFHIKERIDGMYDMPLGNSTSPRCWKQGMWAASGGWVRRRCQMSGQYVLRWGCGWVYRMSSRKILQHCSFKMYRVWLYVQSFRTLRSSLHWSVIDYGCTHHRCRGFSTLSKIQKETGSNQTKVEIRSVSSEAARQDKANRHQAHDRYDTFSFIITLSRIWNYTTTTGAWKLSPQEVTLEEKIASGAFGEVWKGALHDRWIVAIKKLFPQSGSSSNVSSVSSVSKKRRNSLELFKDQEIRFLIRTWCSSA